MPSLNSSANVAQMIKSNVFYYEEKCFYFGTLVPAKVFYTMDKFCIFFRLKKRKENEFNLEIIIFFFFLNSIQ